MKCLKRSTLAGSVAACFCIGLGAPSLAAEPAATGMAAPPSPGEKNITAVKPAAKCLSDLRAFDRQREKDGYWLGGSGYGYGYPVGGYGYGSPIGRYPATSANGYENARTGYEVRALIVSANILARHGQEQRCEDLLTTTRHIYKLYLADIHRGRLPMVDEPAWRQEQIAAAQPVTGNDTSFRSDQLLGTEVRNAQSEALGNVDDLVISPKTGKIAYLVIGRGGIFGIDEKYDPIPWKDFKVAPNVSLLVLDATEAALAAAPQVTHDQFTSPGQFEQERKKVDAYWKAHLSNKGNG